MIHLQIKVGKPFWKQKVFQRAVYAGTAVWMGITCWWMKDHAFIERAIIHGMLGFTSFIYFCESYDERD